MQIIVFLKYNLIRTNTHNFNINRTLKEWRFNKFRTYLNYTWYKIQKIQTVYSKKSRIFIAGFNAIFALLKWYHVKVYSRACNTIFTESQNKNDTCCVMNSHNLSKQQLNDFPIALYIQLIQKLFQIIFYLTWTYKVLFRISIEKTFSNIFLHCTPGT
jgi:nicotinic acid mononucleotide adenylyltransferase